MKVYIVFAQNKVYQEILNVHTSLEEAQKEAANFRSLMGLACDVGYPGAIVVERDLIEEKK